MRSAARRDGADRQAGAMAVEINNTTADDLLAAKMPAVRAIAAQLLP